MLTFEENRKKEIKRQIGIAKSCYKIKIMLQYQNHVTRSKSCYNIKIMLQDQKSEQLTPKTGNED